MIKKQLLILLLILGSSSMIVAQNERFELDAFYQYDSKLDYIVDSIYRHLTPKERVAQMIITSGGELGYPQEKVAQLAKDTLIGGVIFLKGKKETHKENIQSLNSISHDNHTTPLLYSIDAEPSLFAGRLKGAPNVGRTIDIDSKQKSDSIVHIINTELKDIGMHHNYAPVVDVSDDNEAIKSRSYGSNKDSVVYYSKMFITESQDQGIIATAKHFPGHGLVKGDTHKQSVYIDGELLEKDNYKPLIDAGVLSIMVAHIVVKNNEKYDTNGLPSTVSPVIVTGLLKETLNFKGIIITDAMNIMKAVTIIDNAPLLASKAGCDLLLMPPDEAALMNSILHELSINPSYRKQVEQSVKKIIRLKVCAGVINAY